MTPTWQSDCGRVVLYCADCLAILPTLAPGSVDAVVTDPPYGMGKAPWDRAIPQWLHAVHGLPTVAFCGVVGMRDYPTPDWVGAWVRLGSVQRNGRLKGFNNWEPLLFYNIKRLVNDVVSCPNLHDNTGHPTTKPTALIVKLLELMPGATILDPFMGSGTTGIACIRTGRRFVGIEIDPHYFEVARARIERELAQPMLPQAAPAPAPTQPELLEVSP